MFVSLEWSLVQTFTVESIGRVSYELRSNLMVYILQCYYRSAEGLSLLHQCCWAS